MSLLCGRPVSWGTEPRINSCKFTELNSLYLRISCHSIYAISHVHTIPINRCAFYMLLLLMSLGVLLKVRNYGILRFSELSKFPPLELVHITASIEATYLRQRQAHMKSVEQSTGTSKRLRGEAFTTAFASGTMLAIEETFMGLTAVVDPFGGADDVDPTVASPLSLRVMMESFTTTQAAHG